MSRKQNCIRSLIGALVSAPLLIGALPKTDGSGDNGLLLLFLAYAISWLVFFAYLLSISRKQKELSDELSLLRLDLEREPANSKG